VGLHHEVSLYRAGFHIVRARFHIVRTRFHIVEARIHIVRVRIQRRRRSQIPAQGWFPTLGKEVEIESNAESVGEDLREFANAFSVERRYVLFPQGCRKLQPWAGIS